MPANQVRQPFYIWGAQLEKGSFVTSYIPAAGSPVTRQADFAFITDMTWLRQGQGTFFADFSIPHLQDTATTRVLGLRGSEDDRLIFYRSGQNSNFFWTTVITKGLTQYQRPDGQRHRLQENLRQRAVLSYQNGLFRSAINGIGHEAPGGSVFTNADTLFLGSWQGNQYQLNGHLRGVLYWPTPKSEIEAIELSYPDDEYVFQVVQGTQDLLKKESNVLALTPGSVQGHFRSEIFDFEMWMDRINKGVSSNARLRMSLDGQRWDSQLSCVTQ
jgi:hypothetical protein